MAPVATNEKTNGASIASLKEAVKPFNPFYSPPSTDENDESYEFAHYKVLNMLHVMYHQAADSAPPRLQPYFPDVKWAPLEELAVTERGTFADKDKKALLSAASKVQHLTPVIGTELSGIDLRQLNEQQKDELCVIELRCGPACV